MYLFIYLFFISLYYLLRSETNLKPLKALTPTSTMTEKQITKIIGELHCEEPHNQLYSFSAKFILKQVNLQKTKKKNKENIN
jgi:hypothetical protein